MSRAAEGSQAVRDGGGLSLSRAVKTVFDFVERDRNPALLVVLAASLAVGYVILSFDAGFLSGDGSFWRDPRGPWLMDAGDRRESADVIDYLAGYRGFLNTSWHLPLFFLPNLGAPTGTNIAFIDAMPIVSLLGKIASELSGRVVNPFGMYVGACFVLSAVTAALVMIELRRRSFLATLGATVFALTLPALLHRFGHFPLLAQFVIIGAILFYLRDRRPGRCCARGLRWGAWLSLALLLNIYLAAMAGALYGASWLQRLAAKDAKLRPLFSEAAVAGAALAAVVAAAGHLGRGAAAGGVTSADYGFFSMNLLSPVWPQRSGLFAGFSSIVDGTGGQYEGFNYLGFGALTLVAVALVLDKANLVARVRANLRLALVMAALALFAVSNVVYVGGVEVLHVPIGARLWHALGIFRSSGRMFWPVAYIAIFYSLAVVLREVPPRWRTGFVLACCALQFIDTEPLRARMLSLSKISVSPPIDRPEWVERISKASGIYLYPTFQCLPDGTDMRLNLISLELQYAAMIADRPINSVYNPRLSIDCAAETESVRKGPWHEDALYVFLASPPGVAAQPASLSCAKFDFGTWCRGPRPKIP